MAVPKRKTSKSKRNKRRSHHKISSINKKSRAINFTDNSKKSVENINSFHELSKCEEIKKFAKKKQVLDVAKIFLNSDPAIVFTG